jgi:hypothetical protein
LLYIRQVLKPMDVENFSNLANRVLTHSSTLVIAEGLDILAITALALILVLLAARMVKRKRGVVKSFRARGTTANNKRAAGRLFERQRSLALKPCPNCAEQLPLSAVICDTCEYNFLAERPGRGQTLLPSPQAMTDEALKQKIASAGL